MATPEKALAERIWREEDIDRLDKLQDFLEGDLRADLRSQHLFSISHLKEIKRVYKSPIVDLLFELLSKRIQA